MCQIESQVCLSKFSLIHRSFLHKGHFQENILIIFSLSLSLLDLFILRCLFSFSRIIVSRTAWQKVPSPTLMTSFGKVCFSLCLFWDYLGLLLETADEIVSIGKVIGPIVKIHLKQSLSTDRLDFLIE